MDNSIPRKQQAVEAAIATFDSTFFKALCEPSRIGVLKRVMLLGRADISEIAADLPQERSVVSRHLQTLQDAGILRTAKEGRQVFYEVDGPAIVSRLEAILQQCKAIAPYCCPATPG
ncbi:MAG TPA: metalloregulator ArsR/SmtB family transcription factor [Pseudomonas sp.]|nr:metalloregulator ArsR/SmtB family transcription factor [Pseudomonas sp.]